MVTLKTIHASLTKLIANIIRFVFSYSAKLLGFPENPGMKFRSEIDYEWYRQPKFDLPVHRLKIPPDCIPRSWIEIVFGNSPTVSPHIRTFYKDAEGFYNFYIENYRNLVMMPDWLSGFLQIHLNVYIDTTALEIARETFFIAIIGYYHLICFRLFLNWFLSINPYSFPIVYIVALTDWFENNIGHMIPSVNGIGLATPLFLTMVGKTADILNHLVFTMPFLPSEGTAVKIKFGNELKNIIVFRHLPYLWYKHPIPNQLREFWFKERKDILRFYQKAYKDTGINFLPDSQTNVSSLLHDSQTNVSSLLHDSQTNVTSLLHDIKGLELLDHISSLTLINTICNHPLIDLDNIKTFLDLFLVSN